MRELRLPDPVIPNGKIGDGGPYEVSWLGIQVKEAKT